MLNCQDIIISKGKITRKRLENKKSNIIEVQLANQGESVRASFFGKVLFLILPHGYF